MIIVGADTSGLIAALDSAHPDHRGATAAIAGAGLLVISPLLFAELDHVVTREFGCNVALRAVDDIRGWMRRGRVVVPDVTEELLAVAQAVRARYRALDLDLADAVNVAIAADFVTDAVLTLDRRDFRAVHPLSPHKAFRILPDDL